MGTKSQRPFLNTLIVIIAAIGIGSFLAFPYYSSKFSGFFFLPLIITLVLVAVPIISLEFSLGRYLKKNAVDSMISIRPWLSTIGWFMSLNAFILVIIYAVVLAWAVVYLFASIGFQWKNDATGYFFHNVLHISNGFYGFSSFSLPVFISLIFAWIIVYFIIKKGYDSFRELVYLVPLFLVLLLLLMIYFLNKSEGLKGVYTMFNSRNFSLLDFRIWIAALKIAVFGTGISFGLFSLLSSKHNGPIFRNSLLSVSVKIIFGFAFGIVLFSVLGVVSSKENIPIEKLNVLEHKDIFIAAARAFPHQENILIALAFFAFIALIILFGIKALSLPLIEVLNHKLKTESRNSALILAGFGFLTGLIFATRPGFHLMSIVMHFFPYNILAALLLYIIAICWIFDFDKLKEIVSQRTILPLAVIWKYYIKVLVPVILLFLTYVQIKDDISTIYNGYPLWAILVFGLGTIIVPLMMAFILPEKILDKD